MSVTLQGLLGAESYIKTRLLERDDQIRMAIIAVLAKQHVAMVGNPGVAKSSLARLIAGCFGVPLFNQAFSSSTVTDDLFGAMDAAQWLKGQRVRMDTGRTYLQDATIAILDEWTRGGRAIDTCLTVLEEREFEGKKIALTSAFALSNHMPNEAQMAAWSRFAVKMWPKPILKESSIHRLMLMAQAAQPEKPQVFINAAELTQHQANVKNVTLGGDILKTVAQIFKVLQNENILLPDRTLVQVVPLLQASAYLNGSSEVEAEDLATVLPWVFCITEQHQETVRNKLEQFVKLSSNNFKDVAKKISSILSGLENAQNDVVDQVARIEFCQKVSANKNELSQSFALAKQELATIKGAKAATCKQELATLQARYDQINDTIKSYLKRVS